MTTPEQHGLRKAVWTHADFEVMCWHDVRLYCFTVLPESFELVMDLDYITKWVHPTPPETHFSFWVAPATLVLHDVKNIAAVIEITLVTELEILAVKRTPAAAGLGWRWMFGLDSGEVALDASGFTQYLRQEPVFSQQQSLGLDRRGGISYERKAFDGATGLAK